MKWTAFNFCGVVVVASGLLLAGTGTVQAQMRPGSMGQQPQQQQQPQPGMQQNNPNAMQQNGQMGTQNPAETKFMAVMRRNSKVETDLSKMAQKNSSNDQVKSFAKQVISENRKNDMALMSAVSPGGNTGPMFAAETPSQTKQAEKQMKKMTGTDFDKMYLSQMDGYVKNDQKNLSDISMSSNSPDLGSLTMQMRNTADDRMKQIAQVAQSENFKIQ